MFENKALEILKRLGFEGIRKPIESSEMGSMMYDYDAEKNDQKYAIEVKATEQGGRFTVPWGELRELAGQLTIRGRKPLLIFIDLSSDEYCIFEMTYTEIGYLKYSFR